MQKPMFQTLYFEDLTVGMREAITKTVEKIEWRCPTLLKEVG